MEKLIYNSENVNPNYSAKIIKVDNLRKHPKADRLQICTIDGNNIITNMDTQLGDIKILFALESAIATDYLSANNDYRDKTLNSNPDKIGFFESNNRVRAIKLKQLPSEGYMVPVETLSFMLSESEIVEIKGMVGTEFDMVKDLELCQKYVNRNTKTKGLPSEKKPKEARLKNLLIDRQFKFHEETSHLGKNMQHINPDDEIVITYKVHGSSSIIANVLIKKELAWYEKFLKMIGVSVVEQEYGFIYSSGKPKSRLPKGIVKEDEEDKYKNPNGDFYKTDIWKRAYLDHKKHLIKGLSIYSELVGFGEAGEFIQKGFDYGCVDNQYKKFVYRINYTNVDGNTIEFTWKQIKQYCEVNGLTSVPELYFGKAKDLFDLDVDNHWSENFLEKLKEKYLEGNCHLCKNKVPAEGIVVNKYDNLLYFMAYKLKSFAFLEYETKQLDKGEVDIESQESAGEGE